MKDGARRRKKEREKWGKGEGGMNNDCGKVGNGETKKESKSVQGVKRKKQRKNIY